MLARMALPLIALILATGQVLAQANLQPETNPRLPPQPGQGLPIKDREFIVRAANLSDAQIEAGRAAAQRAPSADVKALGERIAADHQKFRQALAELAGKYSVAVQPHASRPAWEAEVKRLQGLNGVAFEREFLAWELQVHLSLADMYQTQASSTPESDLARFAIVSLKQIQDDFNTVKELGARHNLAIETVKPPPQY